MQNDEYLINMTFAMSGGNPIALASVLELMHTKYGMMGLILCDLANIKGIELHLLYKMCCNSDPYKFERTSSMINNKVFSEEQVRRNIYSDNPIPFIDDNIIIEGVPKYGETFGPVHYKWDEYCMANRKSFSKRLNKNFFEEKNKKYIK